MFFLLNPVNVSHVTSDSQLHSGKYCRVASEFSPGQMTPPADEPLQQEATKANAGP